MAVSASDHAALDLFFESRETPASSSHLRNVGPLAGYVIEVEDYEIRLSAIRAARCEQHVAYKDQVPPFGW
jgi:hypothetical protein